MLLRHCSAAHRGTVESTFKSNTSSPQKSKSAKQRRQLPMLEAAPPEYLRIHQDGLKSRPINSVSQQIRSLGTRFHSTNALLQKSRLDGTLRPAIDSKSMSCLSNAYSSYLNFRILQSRYVEGHIPLASIVTLIGFWSH